MLRIDAAAFGAPRAAVLGRCRPKAFPARRATASRCPTSRCSATRRSARTCRARPRGSTTPALPEQRPALPRAAIWLEQSCCSAARDMDDIARAFEKVYEHREALARRTQAQRLTPVSAADPPADQRVVPALTALSENTYLSAIRAGMVSVVPLTIIGGLFMIVAYLPVAGWDAARRAVPAAAAGAGHRDVRPARGSFACFAIAYDLGKRLKQEAIVSATVATRRLPDDPDQRGDQTFAWTRLGSQGFHGDPGGADRRARPEGSSPTRTSSSGCRPTCPRSFTSRSCRSCRCCFLVVVVLADPLRRSASTSTRSCRPCSRRWCSR